MPAVGSHAVVEVVPVAALPVVALVVAAVVVVALAAVVVLVVVPEAAAAVPNLAPEAERRSLSSPIVTLVFSLPVVKKICCSQRARPLVPVCTVKN